ncbi:unnamed protein product [Thlaspi arvense]|uniref:Dof zinc finger protein n=1 Tax=Thlaspi arvense TaxID=13288 RepID=A0AAU9RXV5_THLAR|nr:unnamed protein product [Thlaspi arvense]
MKSDSADRRPTRPHQVGAPAQEPEQLPCPRCASTNTKFCYYNNYNFSQPRHFCKSCRRYWTHGGTLRDIPIGGGSRKNAKRSRTTAPVAPAAAAVTPTASVAATAPILVPLSAGDHGGPVGLNLCGSFTSLLGAQAPGFLALGGFGLGLGHGFEDVSFGFGKSGWGFAGVGEDGAASGGAGGRGSDGAGVVGNAWQLESGEGGFIGGDCFSLPDLAISTPGNGLK